MSESGVIALIAIVASSTVAVVASIVQIRVSRARNQHERELDVEKRTWEARRDMLVEVASWAARMRRLLWFEDPRDPEIVVAELREMTDRVESELLGPVELYASDDVRDAMQVTRTLLFTVDLSEPELWVDLAAAQLDKQRALDAQDFEAAEEHRQTEKELLRELGLPDEPGGVRVLIDTLTYLSTTLRRDVSRFSTNE